MTRMACSAVIAVNPHLAEAISNGEHLHLSGRPEDARLARRFVQSQLDGLDPELVHTAVLLTSELVGNAVLHAGGPMLLGVSRLPARLLVTVADDNHAPVPHRPAPDLEMLAESGRGFQIIAEEAEDFGWHTLPDSAGKIVWFTLGIG
jgi:anti-sigma regulatory factor (Ser/Thr protein kinase)